MRVFQLAFRAGLLLSLASLGLLAPAVARANRPGTSLPDCGSNIEFLGFSDALNKSTFSDFDVAEISGLAYDPETELFYAVADRAGTVAGHFFTLDIPINSESLGTPRVLNATVLKDDYSNPYNGITLDSEGMAFARDSLIIASEGGSGDGQQPEIIRFNLEGGYLGELPVASHFLIGKNNLSFESLAISPNRHSLFTVFEGPLSIDGKTSDNRSRLRIVRYDDRGPEGYHQAAEYFYLTEPGRTPDELGVSEMIALSEEDLFVLERGFVAALGNTIRIFRVSIKGATDISSEPTLNAASLTPLGKELVIDLVNCPSDGAASLQVQPNPLLDNFETMALGPELPGGRQTLILVSDDNNSANQITRIVALAIPTRGLVGQDDSPNWGNAKH